MQRSDQEIELNEAFGFRVEVDLTSQELIKQHDEFGEPVFNYMNIPFYVEVELHCAKCKFCEKSYKEVLEEFSKTHLRKAQTVTLALKNPIKGLNNFMFINYKGDHLSH